MEHAEKYFKLKNISTPKLACHTAYYFIASVLLISGIAKILDPLPLIETIKLITILPNSLQILIATLLPVLEIGLAVLMLSKTKLKITLPAVAVLFAFFLVFSIYGTVVGLGGDCGCFGDIIKSEFGLAMIVRNLLFLIIATLLWLDKLSISNK